MTMMMVKFSNDDDNKNTDGDDDISIDNNTVVSKLIIKPKTIPTAIPWSALFKRAILIM